MSIHASRSLTFVVGETETPKQDEKGEVVAETYMGWSVHLHTNTHTNSHTHTHMHARNYTHRNTPTETHSQMHVTGLSESVN